MSIRRDVSIDCMSSTRTQGRVWHGDHDHAITRAHRFLSLRLAEDAVRPSIRVMTPASSAHDTPKDPGSGRRGIRRLRSSTGDDAPKPISPIRLPSRTASRRRPPLPRSAHELLAPNGSGTTGFPPDSDPIAEFAAHVREVARTGDAVPGNRAPESFVMPAPSSADIEVAHVGTSSSWQISEEQSKKVTPVPAGASEASCARPVR